ncbi:MAG: hypothetical protein HKP20_05120 [Akkermansiaceae bacterium]|nr:hypothetical protein [Akkermansiaceae bacterium]
MSIAKSASIPSIDYLTAQSKTSQPRVYMQAPISPELVQSAATKSCQIILIDPNNNHPELGEKIDDLAPGSATVVVRDKITGTASTASELAKLLQ